MYPAPALAAYVAPAVGLVADLPAGLDPDELAAAPGTSARRGKLRRRAAFLRSARELLLRDLGGFDYELQRTAHGVEHEAHRRLRETKLARLARVDAELHVLEVRLDDVRRQVVVREPGVGGECPHCSELYASAAHYCSHCGNPLTEAARRELARAQQADTGRGMTVTRTTSWWERPMMRRVPSSSPGAAVLWASRLPRRMPRASRTRPRIRSRSPSRSTARRYSDGRDTLPGYDDELCTPIPNVQYDFGENQILYYNSEGELLKTARWTEWARISSYQTWLDQQNAGDADAHRHRDRDARSDERAPTSPAPTSPAPTSPPTTSSADRRVPRPRIRRPRARRPSVASTKSAVDQELDDQELDDQERRRPRAPRPRGRAPRALPRRARRRQATVVARHEERHADGHARERRRRRGTGGRGRRRGRRGRRYDAGPRAPCLSGASAAGRCRPRRRHSSPETTTKFKLASESLGTGGGMGDTRPAGIGILLALLALAGLSFLFRGYARR